MVDAGSDQSWELSSGLPGGLRGPNTWGHLLPFTRVGLKVEQPGLQLELIWNTGMAGSRLIPNTILQVPETGIFV